MPSVLKRDPHPFSAQEFRDYVKLCGEESVDIYLDAAVEFVQNETCISIVAMDVLFEASGGRHRLPYTPVGHVKSVKAITGHGVPLNGVKYDIENDYICLPRLPHYSSRVSRRQMHHVNHAHEVEHGEARYQVIYKTKPYDISANLKLAVFQVAGDLFDGAPIRDISHMTSGIGPGKMAKFISDVGGINPRLR